MLAGTASARSQRSCTESATTTTSVTPIVTATTPVLPVSYTDSRGEQIEITEAEKILALDVTR